MLTTKQQSEEFAVTNMMNELTAESTQISSADHLCKGGKDHHSSNGNSSPRLKITDVTNIQLTKSIALLPDPIPDMKRK